jgi:hypothetical protein
MAAQSTAEASKKEACFHVESQRIAEGTIPYQPISWSHQTIIWECDSIHCAKTARILQCKICMTERKEILHYRFRSDKLKIMNDNSDIYSSCKCKGRFHRFGRKINIETLRSCSSQKKVNSTLPSQEPRRNRFSFNLSSPRYCQSTNKEAPVTPEP